MFHPILSQAHAWVERALKPGDLAVDATVGNGRDAAILAGRVGPKGLVIGFDPQQDALDAASARLAAAGAADRVVLVKAGHERMAEVLAAVAPGRRPRAVMFNLGYRPGGDHAFATRPETTLVALAAAVEITLPGGLVTAIGYTGHPGGEEEQQAVLAWAQALPPRRASVVRYQFWNAHASPCLIAISPK